MSHITDVKLRIRDLDALAVAGLACDLELARDVDHFKWFGRFVGDSPGVAGRDPATYGQCEHVLRLKNARQGDYEIGVVRALDGDGYDLHVDTWNQRRLIEAVGGPEMNKLRREYSAVVALKRAKQKLAVKGFVARPREELAGGRIRLRLVAR